MANNNENTNNTVVTNIGQALNDTPDKSYRKIMSVVGAQTFTNINIKNLKETVKFLWGVGVKVQGEWLQASKTGWSYGEISVTEWVPGGLAADGAMAPIEIGHLVVTEEHGSEYIPLGQEWPRGVTRAVPVAEHVTMFEELEGVEEEKWKEWEEIELSFGK